MDKISPERRSENMRRIRSTDTKPELVVRSLLHKLGYRFRLHRAGLPGRPDIVFPSRRKAIFVHGCFWHQHHACIDGRVPKSNSAYWREKLLKNTARDVTSRRQLTKMGWPTLVIWECKVRDEAWLTKQLKRFLDL